MISLSTAIEEVSAAFKRGVESRDAEIAELRLIIATDTGSESAVSDLQNEISTLRDQLKASRENDRTAMMYLCEIKTAAVHDGDFPSLVVKVATLREQVKGRAKAQVSGACLLERREEDRQQILSLREKVEVLRKLLLRYRTEVKPGYQPHMICLEVDSALAATEQKEIPE